MKMLMSSGRTIEQGKALYHKEAECYSRSTSVCYLHPMDMMDLDIENGETVLVSSPVSSVVFTAIQSPETPRGIIYMPLGPYCNALLTGNTHSTGAPDFKGITVDVSSTTDTSVSATDLMTELGGVPFDLPTADKVPGCPDGEVVVQHAVCPMCGCVCDDLEIHFSNGKVTEVVNGCTLSAEKFKAAGRLLSPAVREGDTWRYTDYDEAITKTALCLARAKRPLLYGWSSTSAEAMQVGIELAEEVGGVIDNCSSECHGPTVLAIQEVGHPGCTLGQVKNRADVVVYWACNPQVAHPRHMSRYTTYTTGYFRKEGREDRTIIVVDIRESETAKLADVFLKIKPGSDFAIFNALRAIVSGKGDILPDEIGGVEKGQLLRLGDILLSAQFGIFFTGVGLTHSRGKYKNVRAGIELIDELSRHTKYALSPLKGHWNVDGTCHIFSLTTGYPFAIDYSRGIAYYNPGETSGIDLLERNEVDCCLVVSTDIGAHFPRTSIERLGKIHTIVLDPYVSLTTPFAKIQLPGSVIGVDAEGTAYRMDGIPIHVRKILDSSVPSDKEILERILSEVRRIKKEQTENDLNSGELM
ncbi:MULTISPECIES: formylmethanofuran dehydrogenase subunit B [Methanocorpusculum]|uniref:Formylmethanofuran dehydrogenase n=1 Tax=Methanocorpusculum parvum TaxID=2193 RepID=A0AAX0Q9J9_9EURY|nr:formylmethanofuran dehydrogenase subunit B [Methanocorpusculum parvum]NLC90628.1 formylmethanofuran dehydrogenase subunit B [Methanocorpusculum parvum]PAV10064.1 formylmethanofuran dehydrogenase [Methanocorpusculum parvum]